MLVFWVSKVLLFGPWAIERIDNLVCVAVVTFRAYRFGVQVLAVFYFVYYLCFRLSRPSFDVKCFIALDYQDSVLTLNVMQVLAVFYFVYYLCFRLSRPSFDVKCFIALWLFPNQCFSL